MPMRCTTIPAADHSTHAPGGTKLHPKTRIASAADAQTAKPTATRIRASKREIISKEESAAASLSPQLAVSIL